MFNYDDGIEDEDIKSCYEPSEENVMANVMTNDDKITEFSKNVTKYNQQTIERFFHKLKIHDGCSKSSHLSLSEMCLLLYLLKYKESEK